MSPEAVRDHLTQRVRNDRIIDFWLWWHLRASHKHVDMPPVEYVEDHIRLSPRYTSDINMALTLLKESDHWDLSTRLDGQFGFSLTREISARDHTDFTVDVVAWSAPAAICLGAVNALINGRQFK